MATVGDRSQYIRQNVQNALGDSQGRSPRGKQSVVYDCLNRVQRRLAEDSEAREVQENFELIATQELYDLPDGCLRLIKFVPPSGTQKIEKVSLEEVDRLKRQSNAENASSDTEDLCYYTWGSQVGFLSQSGAAPSSDSTLTCYFIKSVDSTEVMSNTVDPVLDARWDSCLYYGAVAELTGDAKWWGLFEREVDRLSNIEKTNNPVTGEIESTSEYD